MTFVGTMTSDAVCGNGFVDVKTDSQNCGACAASPAHRARCARSGVCVRRAACRVTRSAMVAARTRQTAVANYVLRRGAARSALRVPAVRAGHVHGELRQQRELQVRAAARASTSRPTPGTAGTASCPCNGGEVCCGGSCAGACGGNTTPCNLNCTNLNIDKANCGLATTSARGGFPPATPGPAPDSRADKLSTPCRSTAYRRCSRSASGPKRKPSRLSLKR